MKTTIFTLGILCILCAGTALGQNAAVLQNTPQPLQMSDHTQRATEHALARETTLLSTNPYGYAKGEVPLSDLASPTYSTPLGDVARAYRKEHMSAPKAVRSWDNP